MAPVKENVERASRQGKNISIEIWSLWALIKAVILTFQGNSSPPDIRQHKIFQNFPTSPALAAPNAPPWSTGVNPKVSPLRGPNEMHADFLPRLETAISRTVIGEEAKRQLEKLLAYENANQECQRAIAPMCETGTIFDYLKACRNLGSETQKMHMLAEIMVATFRKGNERCFTCGDKTHLKRDCPKKAKKKKNPPKFCPPLL